jgi:hypothetical protein
MKDWTVAFLSAVLFLLTVIWSVYIIIWALTW